MKCGKIKFPSLFVIRIRHKNIESYAFILGTTTCCGFLLERSCLSLTIYDEIKLITCFMASFYTADIHVFK